MVSIAHPLSASILTDGSARARAMPPSDVDTHQSVARPGSTKHIKSMVEQAADLAAPPIVLYIDKHRLGRDCVSEQLASQLSQYTIESLASMSELKEAGDWSNQSLIVLHAHGASVATAEIAGEIAMIAEVAPGVPFVVMSDHENATEALLTIRSGARGYFPASLPLSQVMTAIRFVAEGGTYIPTCVLTAASVPPRPSPIRQMDGDGNPITFSPRQRQVLERLRQGKQNKLIAYELGMCESTVKVHIRHIMKKLNARNRTQVVLLTNNANIGPAEEFAAQLPVPHSA
jgi:DNA-binding NarL/FixJ family response regulator